MARKYLTSWEAYLFASKVVMNTLKQYAYAGHEFSMSKTWRYIEKHYEPQWVPAKIVATAARNSANTWLRRYTLCKQCVGEGCLSCRFTGERFHEEPLLWHEGTPSTFRVDIGLERTLIDSEMRRYELSRQDDDPRLGWLVRQLETPMEEAYRDWQHRDW